MGRVVAAGRCADVEGGRQGDALDRYGRLFVRLSAVGGIRWKRDADWLAMGGGSLRDGEHDRGEGASE